MLLPPEMLLDQEVCLHMESPPKAPEVHSHGRSAPSLSLLLKAFTESKHATHGWDAFFLFTEHSTQTRFLLGFSGDQFQAAQQVCWLHQASLHYSLAHACPWCAGYIWKLCSVFSYSSNSCCHHSFHLGADILQCHFTPA